MRPDERRSARKAAKPVPTFGDIAQLVITDAQSKSTNTKVRYQWSATSARPIQGPCWRATVPHAVVEQAMGHQVGTQVERAYRRTDVLDKRRALMEAWAQWCEPNEARRGYVEPFGNSTAAAS